MALVVLSVEKCRMPLVSCWKSTPSRSQTAAPTGPAGLAVPLQLRWMLSENPAAVGSVGSAQATALIGPSDAYLHGSRNCKLYKLYAAAEETDSVSYNLGGDCAQEN